MFEESKETAILSVSWFLSAGFPASVSLTPSVALCHSDSPLVCVFLPLTLSLSVSALNFFLRCLPLPVSPHPLSVSVSFLLSLCVFISLSPVSLHPCTPPATCKALLTSASICLSPSGKLFKHALK